MSLMNKTKRTSLKKLLHLILLATLRELILALTADLLAKMQKQKKIKKKAQKMKTIIKNLTKNNQSRSA